MTTDNKQSVLTDAQIKQIATMMNRRYPLAFARAIEQAVLSKLSGAGQPARDWTEDFAHENGNYQCACVQCGEHFFGHKRRVVCKACYAASQASAEARLVFPAHLRKMWSGGEVQAWIDEQLGTTAPKATAKGSLERYRKWQADQANARNAALEDAAKIPRAYAEQLERMGWDKRFPDELCAIFNASTNMADQILALKSAPTAETFDFLAHLTRQREWSERTFGPGSRAKGVVDHIRKELIEIESDPGDLREWVDVIILALDGAWRSGAMPQEIIDAIVAKQAKNEGRVWPDWRTMDPNKAIEHDRSQDAPAAEIGDTPLGGEFAEVLSENYGDLCIRPDTPAKGAGDVDERAACQGLGWKVRERRDSDGELLDCFVEAPRAEGMAYALEVLGDDYSGYGDVEGKLQHCQMIVAWANAPQARTALAAQKPANDTIPRHVAQTLADAIYKAAQRMGIANADHSSLSVSQCLHLLDCMAPAALAQQGKEGS